MRLPGMVRRDDSSSGGAPNYAGRLLWAIWSLTIAAAIFLALRVYCKVTRRRSLWWDDHFLVASWVTVLVSTAMLTEGVKYGIGMHYEDMDPLKMQLGIIISYGAGFATILGAAWSKTSFAITLLRISNGWTTWLVWFIIISVNVVLGVSGTILWIQCWPVRKLWTDMEATCWPKEIVEHYQTFTSIYSGVLDIVLAILPWKIIWNVTINKREKLGALVAMSMGVFSGIIAFLKIISLGDITDGSSTTVNIKIFGTAEPAVAIIAASIPILRAFVRRDAATGSQSIPFVQFSQIPDPGSRSSNTSKKEFDEALVRHTSTRSQPAAGAQDVSCQPGTSELRQGRWGWTR
ncbi:hypothetical protein C8A01DRAFT_50312 [Parachaetomium inaequale]|uniref:Rhodopsin domain-containing protein n=1 Tax=Parachaetomium inaequale TaxID=2588326 RepID=A0AAN6P904_9PEZI|nr:hypothetical protein C8A01DRAFT_50312 [Parachaetomium inaequale]